MLSRRLKWVKFRLRWHTIFFALLGVAAVLPVLIFIGVSLSQSLEQKQALLEQDLLAKAWLISDDVDEEIRAQFDLVRAIADLPLLDPPADIDQLDKWLSRTITHQPFWLSANVFDADEKMIFKLSGWAVKQTTPVEPESLHRAIQTGKITLGSVARGPLGRWGVPIRAPVVRDGKVVYVFSVVLKTSSLDALLANLPVPPDWIAMIADANGVIVARSKDPEHKVGHPISASALEAVKSRQSGIRSATTIEGKKVIASYQVSPLTGWSIHIGVPEEIYRQPVIHQQWLLGIGAFTSLALAVFFSWLLMKEISRRRRVLQLLDQKLRLGSLGELTGRVAHDFNNLLFVIMGNLELLEMTHTCPPQRIDAIRGAAERGLKITDDLLNFSRGGITKPMIVEFNAHVQDVIKISRARFPKNVSIIFDIDRVNSLFVEVDAVQLDLAILNILINSCDAMPNGGQIEVITRKDHDWISLIIRDTGPGIPLDILPRIFDPFFTTKGRKGNGFGLSQVYGFVKQMNGTISIESKDGTTITMNFPSVGQRRSDVA
jgi:signal transduction histidine kinase